MSANWQTTVSGIGAALFTLLTVLAGLPAQIGELSTIIPEPWKPPILKVGITAALILKVWNSLAQKDRATSGSGTLDDPFRKPDSASGGEYTRIIPPLLVLLFLSGCTMVHEGGRVVFSTSSNLRGLHFRTAEGTTLDADTLDNAAIHKAVGDEVAKGLMSGGSAALLQVLR